MRKVFALLAGGAAALSTIAVAPPATAACDGMFFDQMVINVADQAYIDVREVAGPTYLYSIWIYKESNGRQGLQRGGYDPTGSPESCMQDANPDMLIF